MQNKDFWDDTYNIKKNANQSPFSEELHTRILSLIPTDVESILDAGCGGGALMLKLVKKKEWRLSGIDLSHTGTDYIKDHLQLDACQGSIVNMNFRDNQFDLVICSEVLEHLSNSDLPLAISELFRVSKKYVLITTPYKENLRYHQVKCSNCKSTFHPAGHIRSVNESFFKENLLEYSQNYKTFFSGTREFRSPFWADICRSLGYNIIMLDNLKCPLCSVDLSRKKFPILLKIIHYMYRIIQKLSQKTGVGTTPNNIIVLAEK